MKLLSKRQQDTYLRLVQELPLVSIGSDEHLIAAQEMIDRLTDQKKLDGGEQAYLDALCDLVVVYEDRHYSLPVASDADLLRHLMEEGRHANSNPQGDRSCQERAFGNPGGKEAVQQGNDRHVGNVLSRAAIGADGEHRRREIE